MKSAAFVMNAISCLCLIWLFYIFHKVKMQMKSRAWFIIHLSFVCLLIKWLFDAWLLYGVVVDLYTIVHETLTLIFAINITVGFTIFCDDFAAARRWAKKFGINSNDTNKILSKELVKDLDKVFDKENK